MILVFLHAGILIVISLWEIVNSEGRGVMLKLTCRLNSFFNFLEMKVKHSLAGAGCFCFSIFLIVLNEVVNVCVALVSFRHINNLCP